MSSIVENASEFLIQAETYKIVAPNLSNTYMGHMLMWSWIPV